MGDFDFWVGTWVAEWEAGDGTGRQRGRNVVTSELDGKVVLERFDGRPGVDLRGMSLSVHDGTEWRQTWVDDQRGYIDLRGGMADGEMVLLSRRDDTEFRMRFSDIRADAFTWTWERRDPGEGWNLLWRIDYRRAG